jgi:hypothetical protein
MKSILLKEELQRISEIMNISPKLIIEGITPSKATEEFLGKLIGGKSSAEAADEILSKIRKGETGVADIAAASEAFGKLLEKEVYTDAERTFVTQIIDKLFPEFVKAENGKLIGLLNNVPNEGARSTLKGMLLDVAGASDIEVAETINLLDSKFNVSPENIRMYRNKLKPRPIEVPKNPVEIPTSGVGSRTSSRVSDEIILDIPSFEIKPELENIARNAGIDVNGLSQAVQKDMANETVSRAEKLRLDMMEEVGRLDLEGKKEALRFQKELNELNLLQKEKKIEIDNYDKEIKKLDVLEKEGKITHKQKMNKIEYKKERMSLISEFGKIAYQFRWVITGVLSLAGLVIFIKKRCHWFPAVCDWFDTNQWDDSKSKGGSKKSINDY